MCYRKKNGVSRRCVRTVARTVKRALIQASNLFSFSYIMAGLRGFLRKRIQDVLSYERWIPVSKDGVLYSLSICLWERHPETNMYHRSSLSCSLFTAGIYSSFIPASIGEEEERTRKLYLSTVSFINRWPSTWELSGQRESLLCEGNGPYSTGELFLWSFPCELTWWFPQPGHKRRE